MLAPEAFFVLVVWLTDGRGETRLEADSGLVITGPKLAPTFAVRAVQSAKA